MTGGEQIAGTAFFVAYLAVLPFAAAPILRWAEGLWDVSLSSAMERMIYHYVLFAVTVVIFHGFLARTTRRFLEAPGLAVKTALAGLVALYGLNELLFRLTSRLTGGAANLNDGTVSDRIGSAPHMTFLIVVLLAPFVEETLFRGLVFGGLKAKSRLLAYGVSCVLFALVHVWQFALGRQDIAYFLVMTQYLAPGAVLAWAYDHAGTLWAPFAIHAAANALSAWTLR